MNIGLVGCGRVGITMCYLLRKYNKIVGVYDTNKYRIQKTAKILGLSPRVPLEILCKKSTAIFIATPDNAIVNAYETIEPMLHNNMYLFHFSGALPSTLFPRERQVFRAAVHPFATFPRLIIPPKRKHYQLFIEGNIKARNAAKKIFRGRSFSIRFISKKQKVYCHLVGVFASNFFNALLFDIHKLMEQANMSSDDLHKAVLPLIKGTLSNIEGQGIYRSLSGPLQRGDTHTVKIHLEALRNDPLLLNTYKILSLSILEKQPDNRSKQILQKMLTKN